VVRYHEAARAEFLHEVGYFSSLSVRLGERYDKAVLAAEALAATNPDVGLPCTHKARRVIDRKFKFSMIYIYSDIEVVVIAIAPFRRKPGYWKARVGGG
jgi:hypothetical protein